MRTCDRDGGAVAQLRIELGPAVDAAGLEMPPAAVHRDLQVRMALARDARDALRNGRQPAPVDVEVRRLAGADRGGDQRAPLADGGR